MRVGRELLSEKTCYVVGKHCKPFAVLRVLFMAAFTPFKLFGMTKVLDIKEVMKYRQYYATYCDVIRGKWRQI